MSKKSWDIPYTREQYIGSIPPSKIKIFTVGDAKGDYEYTVSLAASTNIEVRSKALEAARVTATRVLTWLVGEGMFLLKIVPYPHEIVREHSFMGFAGADRLSQGMKLAFGRTIGRAARISAGQVILTVFVPESALDAAKQAVERAAKKLPVKAKLAIQPLEVNA